MFPFLNMLTNFLDYTVHGEVVKALNDTAYAKSVTKRFTEQRRSAVTILGGTLAFNVARGRFTDAADIIILILFCSHISMTYDGINEHTYKAYVESIGPIMFTLVNILPIILSQILLCIELLATYRSKPAAVSLILLVSLPGFLQVLAGSVVRSQEVPPSDVEP